METAKFMHRINTLGLKIAPGGVLSGGNYAPGPIKGRGSYYTTKLCHSTPCGHKNAPLCVGFLFALLEP